MLHGFPQSRHSWRAQVHALAAAGYRVVAPDQRGYSRDARPDPGELSNYRFEVLVSDAIDIADASGWEGDTFHLVGHDWGGQVSWGVADRHPGRLRTLTVLSRPHPSAFLRALKDSDGDQKHRSRHHRSFLDAGTGSSLLADDARRLRSLLATAGVPGHALENYLSVLGNPDALEAALAWYRANPGLGAEVGLIRVPTLYIWGDADQTVGRAAVDATADFVDAAYRCEVLPGVGHFSSDEQPERISRLLLEHLADYRGR